MMPSYRQLTQPSLRPGNTTTIAVDGGETQYGPFGTDVTQLRLAADGAIYFNLFNPSDLGSKGQESYLPADTIDTFPIWPGDVISVYSVGGITRTLTVTEMK